jgi:hypothetical protein
MILPAFNRRARLAAHLFLWLTPPAFGALALALGQDANWDLRNYHWYGAYAWLTGRTGFDLLVAQIPTFYNPLLDVPFYLAATALPAPVVGFLLGAVQGLNSILVFLLTLVAVRNAQASLRVGLAVGLGLMAGLGGGTLGLLGTTFNDNVVSLGVLGSMLVVALTLPRMLDGEAWRAAAWATVAGTLAGAAMGLKQPTVIYGVGLCLAFLMLPTGPGRRLTLAFAFGIGALAAIAVTDGAWMWQLWSDYRNPLFPHMNNIFRSPFAAISDYRNHQFFPTSLWEAVFYPLVFALDPQRVSEVWFIDLRIAVLFVVVPVAVLAALVGRLAGRTVEPVGDRAFTRFLLATLAVTYALWVFMFCIYRYLVPMEIMAPLAIVLAVGIVPVARQMRLVLAVALLVLVQVVVVPADWGRVPWSQNWVEAKIPPIADPFDTMILMGGYYAISHVVPLFPPETPVVRIQSNFLQPDSVGNAYLGIVRRKVAAHQGPFLMLATIPDTPGAARAAALMGLEVDEHQCQVIPNNLGEDLNLCAVRRVPSAAMVPAPGGIARAVE